MTAPELLAEYPDVDVEVERPGTLAWIEREDGSRWTEPHPDDGAAWRWTLEQVLRGDVRDFGAAGQRRLTLSDPAWLQ
jgi:hypothetical protein